MWDLAALWSGLDESIRHGASVRSLRGIPAGFGHLAADPARADAFNRAMTANTWWVAEAFALLPALQGCRHIVDVGGGHGVLMIALLRQHPSLRGTVFDLEHAAAGARQAIENAGVADRAAFVAGDFFDSVPSDADTYVLKSVLHDWPDERCAAILACCLAAVSSGARLFVVERLANLPLGPTATDRAWARSDLNMLWLTAPVSGPSLTSRRCSTRQVSRWLRSTGWQWPFSHRGLRKALSAATRERCLRPGFVGTHVSNIGAQHVGQLCGEAIDHANASRRPPPGARWPLSPEIRATDNS